MNQPVETHYHQPSSSGTNIKIAVLAGVVIALLAACVYLFIQLDRLRTDVAKINESVLAQITNLKDTHAASQQTSKKTIESMRDELETARRQAAMSVGQAKVDAEAKVQEAEKRLLSEQKKQQQAVKAEFADVRKDAEKTKEEIAGVSTQVGEAKKEIETTKTELQGTIDNLKRVTGDLGVQSGHIATNSGEISALKALGERNIFEFNIKKEKQATKVGDVAIQLKRTDQKRNRFTIDVLADDKRTEKKDKNVNEPLQFYTSKARQPYEIVVNSVGKDIIKGYLATPKVQTAR